jgi:hypothetical protein
VFVDVAGGMAGMIVVLARDVLLSGGIAVAVLVDVAGRVAGMVVVLAGLFFLHRLSPVNVPGNLGRRVNAQKSLSCRKDGSKPCDRFALA